MPATISSHLVIAALRLKQQHPNAGAADVLDACFKDRTGSLADLGRDIEPEHPFARLLAEAFGEGLEPGDLTAIARWDACPKRLTDLRPRWHRHVVGRFAAAYGLATGAPPPGPPDATAPAPGTP